MSRKTVEEVARTAAIEAADAFIAEWATPVLDVEFGAASRHALILGIEAATLPALRQREQETAAECARIADLRMDRSIADMIRSRFPKDQG